MRKHATTVTSEVFANHISLIRDRATIVGMDDILESVRGDALLAPNAVAITLDDGYADNLYGALPVFMRYRVPAVCFVTVAFIGTDKLLPHDAADTVEAARLLSWAEVRKLEDGGVEIGSHGLTHIRLSKAPSPTVHTEEIRRSYDILSSRLHKPPRCIAFPFGQKGDYTPETLKESKEAGYLCAFSAQYGWNCGRSNPYELRRIGIDGSDTLFTLRAKLNGALDLLSVTRTRPVRAIIAWVNTLTKRCIRCEY
jgi:peptidoglycan/xylan/chitin deacetylase (PgdA/CDA1 family)